MWTCLLMAVSWPNWKSLAPWVPEVPIESSILLKGRWRSLETAMDAPTVPAEPVVWKMP